MSTDPSEHETPGDEKAPGNDDPIEHEQDPGGEFMEDAPDGLSPGEQGEPGADAAAVPEPDQSAAGEDDDGPLGAEDEQALKLATAEARADENWDRLLRLQAEMENQRKRAQRDVTNARKYALEGIVNDLLPVHDSLEMGIGAAGEDAATAASIREGSELTLKMLSAALEKHNIVAIDPVGEKFNPEFHQAMTMQEVEGHAPNTVVSVMQKGYTLNERLIRPALVMVAK